MAEAKQVVFANEEVVIHKLLSADPIEDAFGKETWHTESQVLLPGQFVAEDEVPSYLVEKIKDGTSSGLSLMSESKAAELAAKAAAIRAAAAGEAINVQGIPSESDANAAALKQAQESIPKKSRTSKESE